MSYGVSITVTYKVTIENKTTKTERPYFFNPDTASGVKDLITQTAQNAKNLGAEISKVEVINEQGNQHRKLTDGEILDLLLTK